MSYFIRIHLIWLSRHILVFYYLKYFYVTKLMLMLMK